VDIKISGTVRSYEKFIPDYTTLSKKNRNVKAKRFDRVSPWKNEENVEWGDMT
jgi:hypothetical protein